MPDIGGAHLKKVLALVLAFACAFTMFAGAAFTDQADISQTEAVDMLTALNVIEGYEDGSFQPDEIVTRAEMAKMIYVIRNGGSDVVTQYEGYKTPFTDVENVNHWAKGYIAYCYANGIIAGTSATTFEPDRAVTGQEAAKMALVLLGYDPDRAGLVGTAWGTNTTNLATQKSLFDDYTVSITAGSPRQFAAQLLYNTLWACTVRWSEDSQSYEDVVTYEDTNDGVTARPLNVTVARRYMGLEGVTGIYLGNNQMPGNGGLRDTESRVRVDGADKTVTFIPDEGNTLVGEAVKVLFKESRDGVSGLDRRDTVYGMTLTDDTSVVKAVLGDIGDGDTKNNKIEIDGTKYDVYSGGIDVYVNYVQENANLDAEDFNKEYKLDSADEIKVILNDAGDATDAYITHVEFREVTGLTSSKITIAGIGTLDIDDDMDLDESVARDDIVAVTTLYADVASDDDAFNIITKAEIVEDVTVDAMRSNDEIRIDGSYAKYAVSNDEVSAFNSDFVQKSAVGSDTMLDGTYDFVMYDGYWVAAREVEAASKDIAMVKRVASGIDDQVRVLLSDGTEATYIIDDDDGEAADLDDLADESLSVKSRLYSYSLVGSDKIQLKNSDVNGLNFDESNSAYYNEDNKTLTVANGRYVTADEAVAFVEVKGDYYTYNIDNLKSFGGTAQQTNNQIVSGSTVEYVLNNDNEVVAMYVKLDHKPGATTSDKEYGYVISEISSTTIDGDRYQTFTVWNGTEEVEINVEGRNTDAEKGAFVQYSIDSEGITDEDVKVLNELNVGAVYSYNSSRQLLTLAVDANASSTNTYAVADDVVIIGVNTADTEGAEGYNSISASITTVDNHRVYQDNIVYVLNTDGEVVAIFTDVDNVIDQSDYDIPASSDGKPIVAD